MTPAVYDVIHILFKRKRVIGLAFLLILVPAILAAFSRPILYRARARIMVTQARAYPQLSAQPDQRRIVPTNDLRLIAAMAESFRSRSFLREVGNALIVNSKSANGHPHNGAAPESGAWWVSRIAKRLEVTPHANAPLIEVAYTAGDPRLAARIVNTTIEQYIGYQARAMIDNPTLRAFYENRRIALKRDLESAEAELTRFQELNNVYSLDTQRAELSRSHAEALQALTLNAAHIRQAEAEAKALTAHLQKLPAQVTLHTYGESPRVIALNAKVVALELELNDLRQLYTDEDRRVKNVMEQLALAQDMLAFEESSAAHTPSATRLESNDAYQNILENALRQEAAAQALRARREEITNAVEAAAARLQEFNRLSYEYERRKAERDAKQVSYQQFLTLLEQARSSEAMDREGLTNVRIVDRAAVPSKPVPSRRFLTLAMGFLASLTVGIAGAFGLEAFSGTVHTRRDGEQRLALPIFAVIPEDR